MSERKPSERKRARMGALARLPVFYSLAGKRVVVAGGTQGAAWKAELLAAAGARVDVYAQAPCREMRDAAHEDQRVRVIGRSWTPRDLDGAAMAIGAFDGEADAKAFAAAARACGVPVNVIDKPAFCDFSFGAIVNRSPLVIGVSTDGAAPVFAQAVRAKLEAMLPQGFARWAAAAARWRAAVQQSGLSFAGRRSFWRAFTLRAIASPDTEPTEAVFKDVMAGIGGAKPDAGAVTLVGAGPGDPELLTLRAVRALQSADVILFDDLVSDEVLDFARREAKKILVGKTGHGASCRQDEINALMVGLAKQGRQVVRLKGGDPLIFARAGEEIAACRAAGLPVEIVPGISAAQGAAARLCVPLTGRGKSRRLQFVTGHDRDGHLPDDIDWPSIADAAATTAIYMPVKTLRPFIRRAMQAGLAPDTPAVAVASATRPRERTIHATAATLADALARAAIAGPVIVMLGHPLAVAQPSSTERGQIAATA
jgi:uroporphyrin-III C-methyltransferase/precorrin-2 dehydrogenase/sirohydrochlorin ferrochelatase